MTKNFEIHIPFNVFSACAVSMARHYIALIEAQLSKVYADERRSAIKQYTSLPDADEGDYAALVHPIDQIFEDEFQPILRFTSVVYLYMVFEKYVSMHVAEIQRLLKSDSAILRKLMKKGNIGVVDAAEIYFRDHADLTFFNDEEWQQLREIAHTRNCIVHDSGIPLHAKNQQSIYALETRTWEGQRVGLEICRYKGSDTGEPMILHQRFLEYCLSVVQHFFQTLGSSAEAKFWK